MSTLFIFNLCKVFINTCGFVKLSNKWARERGWEREWKREREIERGDMIRWIEWERERNINWKRDFIEREKECVRGRETIINGEAIIAR